MTFLKYKFEISQIGPGILGRTGFLLAGAYVILAS
jgi:hypothetical protein